MTKINQKNLYLDLLHLLVIKKLMKKKDAEAMSYALQEIDDSFVKVKNHIIPDILNKSGSDMKVLQDAVWNLREEFRHIQYHIDDGKLTE